jgi:hypothetical protein
MLETAIMAYERKYCSSLEQTLWVLRAVSGCRSGTGPQGVSPALGRA